MPVSVCTVNKASSFTKRKTKNHATCELHNTHVCLTKNKFPSEKPAAASGQGGRWGSVVFRMARPSPTPCRVCYGLCVFWYILSPQRGRSAAAASPNPGSAPAADPTATHGAGRRRRASPDASELQDFRGSKRDALARTPPSAPAPERPPPAEPRKQARRGARLDAAFAATAPDVTAPPRPPAAGHAAITLAPLALPLEKGRMDLVALPPLALPLGKGGMDLAPGAGSLSLTLPSRGPPRRVTGSQRRPSQRPATPHRPHWRPTRRCTPHRCLA